MKEAHQETVERGTVQLRKTMNWFGDQTVVTVGVQYVNLKDSCVEGLIAHGLWGSDSITRALTVIC